MYLLRLDDASEYMDIEKWDRIEKILDEYKIRPIVGVIPDNQDKELVIKYDKCEVFWQKVKTWQSKNWEIALHGYTHVYCTNDGGINPVSNCSEFAGVTLDVQRQKIRDGITIFKSKDIDTKVFFAPSHTFDMYTLEALKLESDIRIISDTVANDIYKKGDFYFIPQQSGHMLRLPFKVVTFCYHPNNMTNGEFNQLEDFIKKNRSEFVNFSDLQFGDNKLSLYSKFLRLTYFLYKKIRKIVNYF